MVIIHSGLETTKSPDVAGSIEKTSCGYASGEDSLASYIRLDGDSPRENRSGCDPYHPKPPPSGAGIFFYLKTAPGTGHHPTRLPACAGRRSDNSSLSYPTSAKFARKLSEGGLPPTGGAQYYTLVQFRGLNCL